MLKPTTIVLANFDEDLSYLISEVQKAYIKKEALNDLITNCNNNKIFDLLTEKYTVAYESWKRAMGVLQDSIFKDFEETPQGAVISVVFVEPTVVITIPVSDEKDAEAHKEIVTQFKLDKRFCVCEGPKYFSYD